jgi:hypothetical protein
LAQPSGTESVAHPPAETDCGLAAFGSVEATPDLLPAWRKDPRLPANLLKYADDQTVVALAAVLRAVSDYRLTGCDFREWAVVAAPRFLGRVSFAAATDKFLRKGARAVSPLIVPFLSLHAVSGAVSQALQCHGPNVGVGGGERGLDQALLTGLVVAAEHRPPGLWLVLSEWDPEPVADEKGRPVVPTRCRALALALVPAAAELGLRLRWAPASNGRPSASPGGPTPSMAGLADFLARRCGPNPPRRWGCPLSWGGSLELTDAGTAVLPGPGGFRPSRVA